MQTRPLSAALLRRLAEAADGFRNGRPIYVVACYDRPRDGLRVFERQADALAHLAGAGEGFGIFGPFATPADGADYRSAVVEVAVTLRAADGGERVARLEGAAYDAFLWSASAVDKFAVPYYAATAGIEAAAEVRRQAMRGAVRGMAHLSDSGFRTPDEALFAPGDAPGEGLRVAEVALVLGDGTVKRFDGREHDAVFWTMPAIDRFVVPYYARTDGPEFAANLRRRAAGAAACALGHYPTSEPTAGDDDDDDGADGYGAPSGRSARRQPLIA